ncbi:hypothetical protein UFOVP247_55 [uncultured Caudovirales phage]|uniref:Uncharacterized protein n=1 Tax=uncultured Caudovirales phage TaxID=2100421 RepID=A0A6J7WVN2_9CAUD|nr:hypothetical protein UFOVP247_55 [uncultured Caudovirales phage]
MNINQLVAMISDIVKEDEIRAELYTRILEESDEYDIEEADIGVDSVFDEIYADYAPTEDMEEFEEDEDYEDDSIEEDDWEDSSSK